ncbi:unnamed protein product [Bemisia tabaci]|uniref:ribonuclease III n=1 Tax=Bemisia tabaci TaxID=7038 RepID=A0A9P0F076_BEMTA|nr:unnamed protein product [Bemisia tabaci]
MAQYLYDSIHTKSFTPQEFQVELLNAAKKRNIIACLGQQSSKSFVALKLIQESAINVRRCSQRERKYIFYVLEKKEDILIHYSRLIHLTDLNCVEFLNPESARDDLLSAKNHANVLIMTYETLFKLVCTHSVVSAKDIHLLILDECHLAIEPKHFLSRTMPYLLKSPVDLDRILGLTSPLFLSGAVHPGKVEAQVKRLEKIIHAKAETASEIVSALRYCPKPRKLIIECASMKIVPEKDSTVDKIVNDSAELLAFLEDHRYDPAEIYDEEFLDEIKDIPDPKSDPIQIVNDFLEILHTLGLWCADKAALLLYFRIEKLKVKTPYERHYLLLCLVSSLMLKVRALLQEAFESTSEKERIFKHSSNKILRLIEIISQYKPMKSKAELEEEFSKLEGISDSQLNTGRIEETSEEEEKNEKQETIMNDICSNLKTLSQDCCGSDVKESSGISNLEMDTSNNCSKTVNVFSKQHDANFSEEALELYFKMKSDNSSISNNLKHDNILDSENEVFPKRTIFNQILNSETNTNLSCSPISDFIKNQNKCVNIYESKLCDNRTCFSDCDKNDWNFYQSYDPSYIKESSSDEEKLGEITFPTHNLQLIKSSPEKFSLTGCEVWKQNKEISNHIVVAKDSNCVSFSDTSKQWSDDGDSNSSVASIREMKFQDQPKPEAHGNVSLIDNERKCVAQLESNSERIEASSKMWNDKCMDSVVSSVNNDLSMMSFSNLSVINGRDNNDEPTLTFNENLPPTVTACDNKSLTTSLSSYNSNLTYNQNSKLLNRRKNWRHDPNAPQRLTTYKLLSLDITECICGLIFVKDKFIAKILYHLLNELRKSDEDFWWLAPQYTVCKSADPVKEPQEADLEHQKQEEVLKRFRMRDCNVLIGTAVLEEGMDLPKCNLVIRFDPPDKYKSYALSRCRARAPDSSYILLVDHQISKSFIQSVAHYTEIDNMLLNRCANFEPTDAEEKEADLYNDAILCYQPIPGEDLPSVSLNTAIAVINRYCAKLPSDTFTRLVPLWSIKTIEFAGKLMSYCIVQLPINSPVKHDIIGHPMPTPVLARRIAALEACRVLHQAGELDNCLQPIGKESFRLLENTEFEEPPDEVDQSIPWDSLEPRPGTTKRRQYYYKRIASVFNYCRPGVGDNALLYFISMTLTCPIPEEQNTRGRKLHPPENSPQGFGILTLKPIPKICSFPIFTRCGEVEIKLKLCPGYIHLNEKQLNKITTFIHYTFTNVLRLQKYLMMFDPGASENSFFIVPTKKADGSGIDSVHIDWDFLDIILQRGNEKPRLIPEEERISFKFNEQLYADAVVTPWYRNQDQPQYFYAAEICFQLNPRSLFPGSDYKTFEEYYRRKYGINIQNKEQPLLDVDHTSARLNFLTPRYVNRKGVALPTSSEETKRAKRENLEQKQILIPELCMVHPFPASLWRKAVSLPCILYRINALLLADEIRSLVATEISLGSRDLSPDFEWPALDFGWRLSDVLKKSLEEKSGRDLKLLNDKECNEPCNELLSQEMRNNGLEEKESCNGSENDQKILEGEAATKNGENKEISADEPKEDSEKAEAEEENGKGSSDEDSGGWNVEIGTWSNDMAGEFGLPDNITMIRYGSPTSWLCKGRSKEGMNLTDDMDSGDDSNSMADSLPDMLMGATTDDDDNDENNKGLKIEFKNDYLAEALETDDHFVDMKAVTHESEWKWDFDTGDNDVDVLTEINRFEEATAENILEIESSGMFVKLDEPAHIFRPLNKQLWSQKALTGANDFPVDEQKTPKTENIIPHISGSTLENSYQSSSVNNYCTIKNLDERTPQPLTVSACVVDSSLPAKQTESSSSVKKLPFILGPETGYGMPQEIAEKLQKESCPPNPCPSPQDYEAGDDSGSLSESSDALDFSFDLQPDLDNIPGPNPSLLLQALTMSNANDGINLERLETIGDSFLKYAITVYLYCTYENIHEGKLSHLRSKQVSNLNLYRLGKRKVFGESMIATKFEPHDNWLPPCYYVPRELEQALIEVGMPASSWNQADLPALRDMSPDKIREVVQEQLVNTLTCLDSIPLDRLPCFVPYNLITQHSIPDKSIADCVEALIGAYLIACGPRGALLFMSWLGIRVLPWKEVECSNPEQSVNHVGCMLNKDNKMVEYTDIKQPSSPLIRNLPNANAEMNKLLDGFDVFERNIHYRFSDRSYLLQAMTHASYFPNRFTDCYQRLEFLGDAVLDYLITRHLYEDKHRHSPGELTDLRSALVNNTIFASLAVRHGFHKFFLHLSPGLAEVVERFVRIQEENGHAINEEYYLIGEEECEEVEDVEVPKALGDVFESVAGAVFLDSSMSLDKVWEIYFRMMKSEIERFSTNVPKSPIRELLELEPETAKFSKPEKLTDGRRVRVTVEVFGKGAFKGIGRNYRIAKCTAAKCALRQLKKKGLLSRKVNCMNLPNHSLP